MHTDPELLSLLALGEPVGTDEDRVHVQTCPTCAGELSELRRLVTLGRSVGADAELTAPDPRVWDRIREELALPPALEPLVSGSSPLADEAAAPTPADTRPGPSGGPSAAPPPSWPTRPWPRSGRDPPPPRVRR